MRTCLNCGQRMGVADTSMLQHWIAKAAASLRNWTDRLGDRIAFVCPACDSYALGVETDTGLPFYSEATAAFLTVNDWDWWNRDSRECDIRQWPDFGCLTFSEASIRNAVVYLRNMTPDIFDAPCLQLLAPSLLGPAGIPEDGNPELEWENQLNILHSRMRHEFSTRELDVAIRYFIQILAEQPPSSTKRQVTKEPKMRATATEISNFFWHCVVAARMADEFPDTTVTRAYFSHAVRKATDCWAGRNGVRYASDAAIAKKSVRGERWDRCGLIKEHVVPVGVVHKIVDAELKATITRGATEPLTLSEAETQGLTAEVVALFQRHPRAWVVARIVREWTLHAWITEDEEKEFDNRERHDGISIRKRMPKGWEINQDRFARYDACGIKVSEVCQG
jgi:hypothetical protein